MQQCENVTMGKSENATMRKFKNAKKQFYLNSTYSSCNTENPSGNILIVHGEQRPLTV
jgi:hypothetical protein